MKYTGIPLLVLALFVGSATYAQDRQLIRDNKTPPKRVALVIGNSTYEKAALKNPVNDATDIATTLREFGFDVTLLENANQTLMKRGIRSFGEKLKNSDVALFYYAGHGVQVNGKNYLIPVEAVVAKQEEIEYEAVDLGFVLAQMENSGSKTNLVILDACRNNPFARSFSTFNSGLASIDAPSGTLLAYATAPGSVANDGEERNGLYTQELLKNMRTPGLGIEDVFKRVRVGVREKTRGKQTPWESSSLVGTFYFASGTATAATPIFEEHFDDNSRKWAEMSDANKTLKIIDGSYHLEIEKNWAVWKWVALTPDTGFKIDCKTTWIDGDETTGYGLIWGLKNLSNQYQFLITAAGRFTVTKYVEGQRTIIIPWAEPTQINRRGSNKLSVEKKDDQLIFSINDAVVGKSKFEPLMGNAIGFSVYNKQKVNFDDLVVTQ